MKARLKLATACLTSLMITSGCSQVTEVSTTELQQVVERDGIPFPIDAIREEVLDRLASNDVVLVGETHFLREHRELMAEFVRLLHGRGFRQLLLEWPQMADWLLADFVEDRGLLPDWEPPVSIGGDLITAIRDFNRTLPEEQRVEVHGIDVNLDDYGGADSFSSSLSALAHHLANPGPLTPFLEGNHGAPAQHADKLESLRHELQSSRSDLIATWGAYWYDTVAEMVEVELASISIRDMREDDYDLSVRVREAVMKYLVDLRLKGDSHRTLINVGGNHAQKSHLKGTEQEWLGDYLVHRSAAAGSVIVLVVTAARITSGPQGARTEYDLTASPGNEIFNVMNRTWPDDIVFLPVDDPLFSSGGVVMNFEGALHVGAPKRHYDAFLLLPSAQRVPID